MDFVVKVTFIHVLSLIVSPPFLEPVLGARHGQWVKERKLMNSRGSEDLVTKLPGQPKVNFQHYSGYVTVNEKNGRALFYRFYEASTLPEQKLPVLWLNEVTGKLNVSGPGCSSVGYGATQEIGPFIVDTEGHDLKLNPYAWNTEANMLFLESPVGVGFSYSNTTTDYDNLGDNFTVNDSYSFLHKWFLKFPSYKTRKFYVAGESYTGKYVPELAELILDKDKDPSLFINLRGILLGNPETSDAEDLKGQVDYAWSYVVVSDETHTTIGVSCDFNSNNPWNNQDCSQAVDEVLRQYKEIEMYSLYTSVCISNSTDSEKTSLHVMFRSTSKMKPRIMGGYDPCVDGYATTYYNRPDVQKALHVSDGQDLRKWSICTGDTDERVPVLSTRYNLSTLGLPITRAWRPWYHNKQVGGWLREYEGLTFATFRGAGHAVPIFKPSESLAFLFLLSSRGVPTFRTLSQLQ